MATSIRQWSSSAAGNNATVAGINFAEGQLPSTVNNSARELMAQLRQWYDPAEAGWIEWVGTVSIASQTVLKLAGDQTAMCMAGRRLRLRGGSVTARYANVVSASFGAETTLTLGSADGSLSASMSIMALALVAPDTLPTRYAGNLDISATLSAAQGVFGGSLKVSATLSASVVQVAAAGSAAAPSLAKADDSDTGIYFPAANEIGMAVGANDAVRIKWDAVNGSALCAIGASTNTSARVLIVDSIGNYPPLEVHALTNSTGVVAFRQKAAGFAATAISIDVSVTSSTSFNFMRLQSTANADVEFNLRGDGTGLCDGSWNGGGADFAELREWSDGNSSATDRAGLTVVLCADGRIRPALQDEEPIGAISARPTVVGGNPLNWPMKHLRDALGRTRRDDKGRLMANPSFDPGQLYIPRDQRREWAAVGLLGFVPIRDGQPTAPRWLRSRPLGEGVTEWLVR